MPTDYNALWQEYQATKAQTQPDIKALWAEYQATKQPKKQEPEAPREGIIDRLQQGMGDFNLSARQMGNYVAGKTGIRSPEEAQKRDQLLAQAAQINNERKGDTGLMDEMNVALGNPALWASLLPGGSLFTQGAIGGGLYEAATPQTEGFNPLEKGKDVATSAGIGGLAGWGLGKAVQAPGALYGAGSKIGRSLFSKSDPEQKAYNIVADEVKDLAPQEIATSFEAAKKRGMGETLDEVLQSRQLMSKKKSIAQSATPAGDKLSKYVENRAETVVPGAVKEWAKPIERKYINKARQIYQMLEGKKIPPSLAGSLKSDPLIADALKTIRREPAYMKAIAGQPDNSFKVMQMVKERLDDVENAALTRGEGRIANAARRSREELITKLEDYMPASYRQANRDYARGKAAQGIIETIKETNDGSVGTLYNRLFAKEANREEVARALGPDLYQGLEILMSGMKNIKKGGLGGSDTAANLGARKVLEEQTGSVMSGVTDITRGGPMGKISNWWDNKVRAKDYDALAKVLTNPDIERLGKAVNAAKTDKAKVEAVNKWAKFFGDRFTRQLGVATVAED